MTSSSRTPNKGTIPKTTTHEVILQVAGEGGGYSIMGEIHQGEWRFWRNSDSGDSWMWDEFDEPGPPKEQPVKPSPGITLVIDYKLSLSDALGSINPGWPLLIPLKVHPEFGKDILHMVQQFFDEKRHRGSAAVISRWQEHCGQHSE